MNKSLAISSPDTSVTKVMPVISFTDSDRRELLVCEEQVASGFGTMVMALLRIHNEHLYREKYPTWEMYVQDRWNMQRTHSYQMLDCARIHLLLLAAPEMSANGEHFPLPTNERQTRPLKKVPDDQVSFVWAKSVERANGAHPSGALVTEVMREIFAPTSAPPKQKLQSSNKAARSTNQQSHDKQEKAVQSVKIMTLMGRQAEETSRPVNNEFTQFTLQSLDYNSTSIEGVSAGENSGQTSDMVQMPSRQSAEIMLDDLAQQTAAGDEPKSDYMSEDAGNGSEVEQPVSESGVENVDTTQAVLVMTSTNPTDEPSHTEGERFALKLARACIDAVRNEIGDATSKRIHDAVYEIVLEAILEQVA